MCPTGYAQNVGHQWAGFLIDDFARELVCGCATRNWNQLLRKAVPPSEIEVGGRCSEFSWPHFSKVLKGGEWGFQDSPESFQFYSRLCASQRPSQSLLVLFTDSYICTGVASLSPALPSSRFCIHVPELLCLLSALAQGSKSTSYVSEPFGHLGGKLPPQIFHKFLQICLWNDPLNITHLIVRHLSVHFLHVCSAPR